MTCGAFRVLKMVSDMFSWSLVPLDPRRYTDSEGVLIPVDGCTAMF